MADPIPRRRMFAAPFGALQTDAPDIQYGNGNALAAPPAPPPRPIAQPFGMLPTAGFNTPPPPPEYPAAQSTLPSDSIKALLPTTRLWSILANALTPSQQTVAATLGAPVDSAAWIARKMGVAVPGDMRAADPTVQANTGQAMAWTPSASIPGSSQYFQNLFDNPPSINALAQTLRHRF